MYMSDAGSVRQSVGRTPSAFFAFGITHGPWICLRGDNREITDGPFDAISSIGMAEHAGSAQYQAYAKALYGLLRSDGRLLNHQIARRPLHDEESYEVDTREVAHFVRVF
jgi:cyclopropane fatty-acyl-phospholipid synthase-like methyltransferase